MISDALRIRLAAARRRLAMITDESVSIADVARNAHLSVDHFIRRFAAIFGNTPHQFRMHARVEWARRELALTDRSVTDISLGSGCSSLGSFSAEFARRTGLSPIAYRQRARRLRPERLAVDLQPGCIELMNQAFSESRPSPVRDFREAQADESG